MGSLQPAQRVLQTGRRSGGLDPALAVLLDHMFGRAGGELVVGELLVEFFDLARHFGDFPLQAGAFCIDIDDVGDRQRDGCVTRIDRQRALRCGVGKGDPAQPCEAGNGVAVAVHPFANVLRPPR